ncbi:O-methyltransferase [Streptomyces flavalbus]|uniref:O-methyltransferase n=1 Tax=Streptomyces flavalbus TaxID=2665155 RepID=A0ABW2W606_9ACTN
MSLSGTAAYDDPTTTGALPPLVQRAVTAARAHGFPYSCRPEQGRLLHALASATGGPIAETGTGYGVGLAWLTSGAPPGTHLISVERDPHRAAIAAELFTDHPNVTVLPGDWHHITDHAPYDLLVLDGGGTGKTPTDPPADPTHLLTPHGTVVIDDFTPSPTWPPTHNGTPDHPRLHWLTHPALHTTEIHLAPDLATVLGRRTGVSQRRRSPS